MVSWWRRTRISRSLAASQRASSTSAWMKRHSVREASFDSIPEASEVRHRLHTIEPGLTQTDSSQAPYEFAHPSGGGGEGSWP